MERIRDYDGRSARRAQQIQEVVGHLGQMSARPVYSREPVPDVAGRDVTIEPFVRNDEVGTLPPQVGWDSEGCYHDPSLRLER